MDSIKYLFNVNPGLFFNFDFFTKMQQDITTNNRLVAYQNGNGLDKQYKPTNQLGSWAKRYFPGRQRLTDLVKQSFKIPLSINPNQTTSTLYEQFKLDSNANPSDAFKLMATRNYLTG